MVELKIEPLGFKDGNFLPSVPPSKGYCPSLVKEEQALEKVMHDWAGVPEVQLVSPLTLLYDNNPVNAEEKLP